MVGETPAFLIRFANRKAYVSLDDCSSGLLCLFLTYADFAQVTVLGYRPS